MARQPSKQDSGADARRNGLQSSSLRGGEMELPVSNAQGQAKRAGEAETQRQVVDVGGVKIPKLWSAGNAPRADSVPEARVSTRSSARGEGSGDGVGGDGHTVVLQGLADFFGKPQVRFDPFLQRASLMLAHSFAHSFSFSLCCVVLP